MTFGVITTESIVGSAQSSNVNRYRNLIIFGTSTESVNINKLVAVTSLSDFTTKFLATSPSLAYFRFLFAQDNTQQNNYYFVNGRDPGASPTQLQNLVFGISRLGTFLDLDASILMCPEAFTLTLQADRTSVYTPLQTACTGKVKHIHLFNTAIATATKAAAIVERSLYQSANGDSSLYYEFYEDNNSSFIPAALHAASIMLMNGTRNEIYEPPSGMDNPASGIKGVRNGNIIIDETDYNDLRNNNINMILLFPKGKYCVGLSRTLASELLWLNINSRIAVNMTLQAVRLAVMPYLQTANDPRGERGRVAERAAIGVLETLYKDGAFTSDETGKEETAYKVLTIAQPTGNKMVTQIRIFIRAVQTNETIQADVVSVGQI
jgi:hypothetical protein